MQFDQCVTFTCCHLVTVVVCCTPPSVVSFKDSLKQRGGIHITCPYPIQLPQKDTELSLTQLLAQPSWERTPDGLPNTAARAASPMHQ